MIACNRIVMLLHRLSVCVFLLKLLVIYCNDLKFPVCFHYGNVALGIIRIRKPSVIHAAGMFQREVVVVDEVECAAVLIRFDFLERYATFLIYTLRCGGQVASSTGCANRSACSFGKYFKALKVRSELRARGKRQNLVRVSGICYWINLHE